jgi:hypothetical protein
MVVRELAVMEISESHKTLKSPSKVQEFSVLSGLDVENPVITIGNERRARQDETGHSYVIVSAW